MLVLPVAGSVGVVGVVGGVVEGFVAVLSVGLPVVGELLPAAGFTAGDEAPVALSVPSEPLLGVVPIVPVEPVTPLDVPAVPIPVFEVPAPVEPAVGAPAAPPVPPAAPPAAPPPAAPPPDCANAPAAARDTEAKIPAAIFPIRILSFLR